MLSKRESEVLSLNISEENLYSVTNKILAFNPNPNENMDSRLKRNFSPVNPAWLVSCFEAFI